MKSKFWAVVLAAVIAMCYPARASALELLLLTAGVPALAVVDDGLLYAVDAQGHKKQFEGAEVVEEETERGTIYWLAVDPDADGANEGLYKGWKGGIYFFGNDGKFISMLERENAQISYVRFCSDGRQFILDSGTYVDREYKLYGFDGLELKKTFYGVGLTWLDHMRFAFSLIDTREKARYEGADFQGRLSVVVYDSAVDLLTTVTEATKTEDFMMGGFDEDTGELLITKFSVKDEKDWPDEEKRVIEEVRAPVPAAG